ncbi:MAG TPA: hypothetical protein VIJ14_04340 [Rhabdochlamydiaceae bacterium]
MRINSFCNHLIRPLTYTDANGETRHLSSQEMSRVTIVVLSSLALTTVEALYSSRSLKSSLISIGIMAGAAFYLATAIFKMISRGDASPPQRNNPISLEPKPSEDPLGEKPVSPKPTPRPSEDLQDSLDAVHAVSSVTDQAAGIEVGDVSDEWVEIADNGKRTTVEPSDVRKPPGSEQERLRGVKSVPVQVNQTSAVSAEDKKGEAHRIQGPPQEQKSYQQLTLTDGQAKVISQMIQIIGDLWLGQLYAKEAELLQMAKQIEHVHPLKFLDTVLNNSVHKIAIISIEDSMIKWRGFLHGKGDSPGFIARCKREDDGKNFEPYITDFCRVVKADLKKVRALYAAKKWEEFIRFLIINK